MKSLVTRCLLVVALVLNGPGAAWSMHDHGEVQQAQAGGAAQADPPAHDHCAGMQGGADRTTERTQHGPQPSTVHSHCGSSSCHCGCAAAAIASPVVVRDLPRWGMDIPSDVSHALVPAHRLTPPFRPPAV